ncbi:MAG: RHS repeat-associated core domain-containing protein [Pyrinomonadaceae bacterium]
MVYDSENRLKQFFRGSNSGSTPDAVYQYDGEGKRVRKIADGTETVFVYNAGGKLVAEYSNQTISNPQSSYLTTDHLGSPRVVTDALGNIRARHDYLAYGEDVTEKLGNVGGRTAAMKYGGSDGVRKQYTGYEKDDESGLDFAQARYYSSLHGRYTGVDPLTASADTRNPQTFNRYSYVLNSPYKFTDPLGLLADDTNACGQWCPQSRTHGSTLFDRTENRDSYFGKRPKSQCTLYYCDEAGHIISQAEYFALKAKVKATNEVDRASNPDQGVFWQHEEGGQLATAKITLTPEMVKQLGDAAQTLANQNDAIREALRTATELVQKLKTSDPNVGYEIHSVEGGTGVISIEITRLNQTVNLGGGAPIGSSSETTLLYTSAIGAVEQHNQLVAKRNEYYTSALTLFQNTFSGQKFIPRSMHYNVPKGVLREKGWTLGKDYDRSFLGEIFRGRIRRDIRN